MSLSRLGWRMRTLVAHGDLELFLDGVQITYGLWLVLPGDTFAGAALYAGLVARGVPDWAWGLLMTAPAAWHLLQRAGGWRRADSTLVCAAFWLFFAVIAAQVAPSSAGVPLFAMLALGYIWAWWRQVRGLAG